MLLMHHLVLEPWSYVSRRVKGQRVSSATSKVMVLFLVRVKVTTTRNHLEGPAGGAIGVRLIPDCWFRFPTANPLQPAIFKFPVLQLLCWSTIELRSNEYEFVEKAIFVCLRNE